MLRGKLAVIVIAGILDFLGLGVGEESDSAQTFLKTWVASGPNAAIDLMDSRTTDSAKEVLRVAGALESFDGKIWDKGESTVTNRDTGDQYSVEVFEVAPVVHWGEDYRPVYFWVGVTKDRKKVILVKLAGQH
jgi:hypothetical protein